MHDEPAGVCESLRVCAQRRVAAPRCQSRLPGFDLRGKQRDAAFHWAADVRADDARQRLTRKA
jgi:hypothetical protein